MRGVSIIVPVYNAVGDARQCLDSIYRARTAIEFEVIVVNNGSTPDVAVWLREEQGRRPNLRVLHFDEPLGFARAINEGARQARHDCLALLNSDTLVTDEWLDRLVGELEKDPALGVVSPVTNHCGHDTQRDDEARRLQPGEAAAYAESIRDRTAVLPEAQRLVFFCVLVRRTLWEQLAGLDEAFGTGNFEDDDFCLRARMAGYRLAVVPHAFVFHSGSKTFEANRLNHGEHLALNQVRFGARVSRWSRTPRPTAAAPAPSLSVIVPVMARRAGGLRDTLASLANQTVQGFETVVVAGGLEVAAVWGEFSPHLRLTFVTAPEDNLAALLNAGRAAASGTETAYLPAGDIYYPFHLEVLREAMARGDAEAVYTAWSVVVPSPERRCPVIFPEAEPGIELGDWAPLLCWLHRESELVCEAEFGEFAGWAFVLRLRQSARTRYVCRVTCERSPDSGPGAIDAERVMARFPVVNAWQQSQREQFMEGVRRGNWETWLIASRQERARRARRLLAAPATPVADGRELERCRRRLSEVAAAIEPAWRPPGKPDIFLFSIIEWSALTQRPQHFAAGLAARGHRVFWVDVQLRAPERVDADHLVRELQPNLYHLQLPAYAGDVYRLEWSPGILEAMAECFDYLRAAYGISSADQLVNFPGWEPLVTRLRRRYGWRVVYDCLDNQQAFADLQGRDLGEAEKILLEHSAAVLVSGRVLLEAMSGSGREARLIPNGTDFELFHNAASGGWLDPLPRPVVGFFGAFSEWLDLDWMEAAAERFPGWSFVYVGREGFTKPASAQRWKQFGQRANVHVFPQASQTKLAQYLAQMDVCTMPFLDIPVTRSMNAVKIYEYLSAGKPVVTPCLPETQPLEELGLIATYRTREESFRLLEAAAAGNESPEVVRRRIEFARRNTWRHRLDELCAALGY